MYQMNIKHFDDYVRMLLRIGCLGVVDQTKTEGRYVYAQFEFNSLDFLHLGANPLLCIHPIYSGSFPTMMSGDRNAVFPLGIELFDGSPPRN